MEIDPYVKIALFYCAVFVVTFICAILMPIWLAAIVAIGFAGGLWYCLYL